MIHKEWRGNKELITKLLTKANLMEVSNGGELKKAMKLVIWCKYVVPYSKFKGTSIKIV